jgi:hypothetical protein
MADWRWVRLPLKLDSTISPDSRWIFLPGNFRFSQDDVFLLPFHQGEHLLGGEIHTPQGYTTGEVWITRIDDRQCALDIEC